MQNELRSSALKSVKPVAVILSILLILGSFIESLPYAYYDFLRLSVTLGSGFIALTFWRNSAILRSLGCFGIALAFNPFVPLKMAKDEWFIIDIAAAMYLIASLISRHQIEGIIKMAGWRRLLGSGLAILVCSSAALYYSTLDDTKSFWGIVFIIYTFSALPVMGMQNAGSRPEGLLPGSVTLRDWDEREKKAKRWLSLWSVGIVLLVSIWAAFG